MNGLSLFYDALLERCLRGQKSLALLLDPDKVDRETALHSIATAVESGVDFFFLGGSLLTDNFSGDIIDRIRALSNRPIILFPGNNLQIHSKADAILLLSLISGRNAEYLIGQHVVAAPILRNAGLEVVSTGYILIDGGKATSVSYISNTQPIPADKPAIAACTAMAGEMLGLKLIYLDAGSGALQVVNRKIIAAVRRAVKTPLIVGGGIDSAEKASEALEAGADLIVIGNGAESRVQLIADVCAKVRQHNEALNIH